jgi:hypothetical protein
MIIQCASLNSKRKAMWRLIVLPDVLFCNLALKGYRSPDRKVMRAALKVQVPAPLLHSFTAAISEASIFKKRVIIT